MTPRIGEDFVGWKPPTGSDETLGVVGFSIFPHLDHADLPENTMTGAEKWAAGIPGPAYAIDDQTAIKVSDGSVEVVSEGHWKLFTPNTGCSCPRNRGAACAPCLPDRAAARGTTVSSRRRSFGSA